MIPPGSMRCSHGTA